jgi:hypothetical protein
MIDLFLEGFGANKFVDVDDTVKLFMRLAVNLAAAWIVIRGIYIRLYRWNEHVFTYIAFNVVTFSLCLMLRKVPIELGFALGLFAVFGILRYRTEPIRIRDLTYLFVVIGLAILNAVANKHVSVVELLSINGIIIIMTYIVEFRGRGNVREYRNVVYDHLELIQPGREEELYADLYQRTGLKVVRFEVESVDLLRDSANLRLECVAQT